MNKHLYETKFTDNIREESTQIFQMVALLGFMGTILVMMMQGLLWFKHGIWTSFNTLELLTPYLPSSFLSWLSNPQSMQGFAKLLQTLLDVELYVALVGIGVIAYILFKIFDPKDPNETIEETDISTLPSRDDWQKDF